MKTVCAWCTSVITQGEGPVSHGICAACRYILSCDETKSLQEFIDALPVPVVVLDGSLRPMCTNRAGRETYRLSEQEVAQCTLGEVVECSNAKLPGGCGQTVHCSGCVLRKTVTETYTRGERASMVPAKIASDSQDVAYHVSSVKVGGCVVVRMEKVKS